MMQELNAEVIVLEGTRPSLKEENDPEMPKEKNEEIKEAVEVDSGCSCSSTKSKKALKASYLSCLGVMVLCCGATMHLGLFLYSFPLALLLYTTITILSFFLKRPKGDLQLTAFGLFSGACLFWFIAAISISISSSYTFYVTGLLGSISNIAAICLLFAHPLRQEDSTLGLFSSLGMFVFALANLLFLGAFGTVLTASDREYGLVFLALWLFLAGGVMFFLHFIFEILATIYHEN